ncbi:MAG: redox-regulated ATPase YchF, partial [Candidatus Omnitrophica bacterium]|nr:redox-regulated ATPase YchF [Candidatus Omnitrophota bacterium]
PQAGKKTLLRLLTRVDAHAVSPANNGVIPGVCPVRDPRVERLAAMYNPSKITPATIQYLLMPDLTKDSAKNQDLLKALALVDVLAHVVRAFSDDTVFHLEGTVDPLRDIETVHAELLLNDLVFVEKRLERIAKEKDRRSSMDRSKEQALLTRLQAHLNDNLPLRTLPLDAEDQKLLSSASLLTRKPMILILNVGEDRVKDYALVEQVKKNLASRTVHVVQVSAKIEEELSQLDDPAERAAFLKELGIAESAIDGLTRVSYEALGLISYFTVGEDEVRAWTVRRGASAAEAGGVIHSDIERGFIRAERLTYQDLITLGSEQAVASAGKAQLKGREYIVQDGDILNFRFNV